MLRAIRTGGGPSRPAVTAGSTGCCLLKGQMNSLPSVIGLPCSLRVLSGAYIFCNPKPFFLVSVGRGGGSGGVITPFALGLSTITAILIM